MIEWFYKRWIHETSEGEEDDEEKAEDQTKEDEIFQAQNRSIEWLRDADYFIFIDSAALRERERGEEIHELCWYCILHI